MPDFKYFLKKKELFFYIFFYLIFSILALSPKFLDKDYSFKSTNKQNVIIAFTTETYLDKKFSNVLPYLEPNAMDHYSYTPKRINYIRNIVKKYYGYDLLSDNKNVKDCNYDYYRSSYLNQCLTKDFWKSLTKNEWLDIARETKINYVITKIPLENLYLCETFINKSKNYEFFYYFIPSKENPYKFCYPLNER